MDNRYNPDRWSQARQSLRELLEKLPRVVLEWYAQVQNRPDLRRQRSNCTHASPGISNVT